MSETVIVLSSGDESNIEDDVQIVSSQLKPECKRKAEIPQELSKKRRIEPKFIGNVQPNSQVKCVYANSGSPDEELHDVVFREFVDTCLEIDNSDNMKKVIEKKLKKYYLLLKPEYRSSEEFITLLERKRAEIQRSCSQRFVHLKEVVDELNTHRSDKKGSPANVSDHFVHKLCKAMELILRKIKKLEEKEVDWDDESDSTYLQLQRYRERLIKIHNKLQELQGSSRGFHRKMSYSGTQFPKVNKAIEKFVNAKAEFPDFYDIYNLLKSSYESENIEINVKMLKVEAKKIFQDVGEKLQKIRKLECWESVRWFLNEEEEDPADTSETLKAILNTNKNKFHEEIDDVINTYAEKSVKPQLASEDSNSSESAVRKEEKTAEDGKEENEKGGREEENGEEDEKGEREEESEEEDDNEEVEEEEGDGEDNETIIETMDDILHVVQQEQLEDDMAETSDDIFLYCGPVSPPPLYDGSSNSEILSCVSRPTVDHSFFDEGGKEETNGENTKNCGESTAYLSSSSCSKFNSLEKQEKTITSFSKNDESNNETENRIVKKEPNLSCESKTLIKVRPLSSLLSQMPKNIPEEILLD